MVDLGSGAAARLLALVGVVINQPGEVVRTCTEYAEKIESTMNYSVAAVRALS